MKTAILILLMGSLAGPAWAARKHPLPVVLEWKYGQVADTASGVITAWRHSTLPQPSEAQLDLDDAEYDAFLNQQAAKFTTVKNFIAARLGITVTDKDDLRVKRGAIYEAIDAKEEQVMTGPGQADAKLNQLRALWNVRNKIESTLSQ